MLLRRQEIVGELQLEGDARSEQHASVESSRAVRARRAARVPALLGHALDLLALTGSAADEQEGGSKHDAQAANSIGIVSLGYQTIDQPALASFQNAGQGKLVRPARCR